MPDKEPILKLHFSFGCHGPEEVQFLNTIAINAFRFFMRYPNSESIYLQEIASGTRRGLGTIRSISARTESFFEGYVQSIAPLPGYGLPQADIDRLLGIILPSDPEFLTVNPEIPLSVFHRSEFVMLDTLLKWRKFTFDSETHSDSDVKRFRDRDLTKSNFDNVAMVKALMGDIESTATAERQYLQLSGELAAERNQYFRLKFSNMLVEAKKQRVPKTVFFRVGEGHEEALRSRPLASPDIPNSVQLEFEYDYGEPLHLLKDKLVAAVSMGHPEVLTDEAVLEALISTLIHDYLGFTTSLTRPERFKLIYGTLSTLTPQDIKNVILSFPKKGREETLSNLITLN